MAEETDFDKLLSKEFTPAKAETEHAKPAATLSKIDATGQLLSGLHNSSQTGIINYEDGGHGIFVKNGTSLGFNLRESQGKVILSFDSIPDGLNRGQLGKYQDAINTLHKTIGVRELNVNDISNLSGKAYGQQTPITEAKVLELSEKLKSDQHQVSQIIKAFASGDDRVISHTLQSQQASNDTDGKKLLDELLAKQTETSADHAASLVAGEKNDFERLLTKEFPPEKTVVSHTEATPKTGHITDESSHLHGAKKLGWAGSAFILAEAATHANEAEASVPEKIGIFANEAADAVPGVTYAKKMSEGKYEEAAVDAASYLPSGIMTAFAREPKVQAIIDALPKDREQLDNMLREPKTPYIDRHLAEYRLQYLDAEDKGNLFDGISASNKLTELAEKKLVLQAEWKKEAETFKAAVQNPETNWNEFAKNNPNLAFQTATHIAAKNEGRPQAFIDNMDANIIKNTASGIPFEGKIQTQVQEANANQNMQLAL